MTAFVFGPEDSAMAPSVGDGSAENTMLSLTSAIHPSDERRREIADNAFTPAAGGLKPLAGR